MIGTDTTHEDCAPSSRKHHSICSFSTFPMPDPLDFSFSVSFDVCAYNVTFPFSRHRSGHLQSNYIRCSTGDAWSVLPACLHRDPAPLKTDALPPCSLVIPAHWILDASKRALPRRTPLTLWGWQAAPSRPRGEAREARGDLAGGEASARAGAAPRFREDFPAGVWVTLTGKDQE